MVKLLLSSALLLLGASTSYLPQVSAKCASPRDLVDIQQPQQDDPLWQRAELPERIDVKQLFEEDEITHRRALEEEDLYLAGKRRLEIERNELNKRAVCTTRRRTSTTTRKTSTTRRRTTTSSTKKRTTSTKRATTSTRRASTTKIRIITTTKKTTTTTRKATSTKPTTTPTSTKPTTTPTSTKPTTTPTSTKPTTTPTSTQPTTTPTSTRPTTTTSTRRTTTTRTSTLPVEPTTTGAWSLVDNYEGTNFFNKWDFFTWDDPTNGNVQYVSQADATAAKLAYLNSKGQAITAVDSTNNYSYGVNRPSVRLQSKISYENGLVLWDIEHMPVGCAVWPALWSNGPGTWPNGGEIDVLEGVGDQYWNSVTLHTARGCMATPDSPTNNYSGTLARQNCYAHNSPVGGCAITSGSESNPTYGSGVNAKKGGIYAVRFDVTGITVWFMPRASIPSDVTAGKPKPDGGSWPEPLARYSSKNCAFPTYFGAQTLIVTMTLCGNWAGSPDVYGANWPGNGERYCPGNCTARVMTGSNFKDAYFTFNSVKVYQQPPQV